MQRTRSAGPDGDRDEPLARWHRHWMAVGISFCLGMLGAAFSAGSAGGCNAADSQQSMNAQEASPAPGSCGTDTSVDPCIAAHCCAPYLACTREPNCLECMHTEGGTCEQLSSYQALLACQSAQCPAVGGMEAGPEPLDTIDANAEPSGLAREVLSLAIIHASANLWPFRVCFKKVDTGLFVGSKPLPSDPNAVMPHSNKVGIAPGSALVFRNAENLFGEGALRLVPYLIRVDRLANRPNDDCAALICDNGSCLLHEDYASLPEVNLSTISTDIAAVMVVHGCLESAGGVTSQRCGGDIQGSGQLAIDTLGPYPLGPEGLDDGLVRVRAAHLSESADSVLLGPPGDAGDAGTLRLLYGNLASPANGAVLLEGEHFLMLQSDDAPVPIPGLATSDLPEYEKMGFTLFAPTSEGGSTHPLRLSLAAVQDLSDSAALPHTFWNSATDFLVALVGDATPKAAQLQDPDGGDNPFFDGVGLHLIALPMRMRPEPDASAGR